jgi:hypothetical protein
MTNGEATTRGRCNARLIVSGPTINGDYWVTREAVRSMAEHLDGHSVPVNIEHDPTRPPVGRVVASSLVELANDELAVDGVIELFDATVEARIVSDSQLISVIEELDPSTTTAQPLRLEIDPRSYQIGDLEPVISAASVAGEVETATDALRFSALPDALLVVGIPSAFWFAQGFFTKLGENAADAVSAELREAYARFKGALRTLVADREPADTPPITLVKFVISRADGKSVEVEGSTRDEGEVLDEFLDAAANLHGIARAYVELMGEVCDPVRLHFKFTEGQWEFAYGLDEAAERLMLLVVSDSYYETMLRRIDEPDALPADAENSSE